MAKSYAVIGLGFFGRETAIQLSEKGKDVIAIDRDMSRVEQVADQVMKAAAADATKRDLLVKLGVDKCDCAIVGMASDFAAAVLITMNLKSLGIKEIICKVQNTQNKEILETLGATRVIIPEKVAADRLVQRLVSKNMLDFIEISDDYSIVEMTVPEIWIDKNLKDTNIRAIYGVNIIAIKRGTGITVSPRADFTMHKDDILVVLGTNENIEKIEVI